MNDVGTEYVFLPLTMKLRHLLHFDNAFINLIFFVLSLVDLHGITGRKLKIKKVKVYSLLWFANLTETSKLQQTWRIPF